MDFALVIQLLMQHYDTVPRLALVVDNLSTHTPEMLSRHLLPEVAQRILEKIEWHYTPKHANWLNMAENEIGVLDKQCLDRRFDSVEHLRAETLAYTADRNARAVRINWTYTISEAQKKFPELAIIKKQIEGEATVPGRSESVPNKDTSTPSEDVALLKPHYPSSNEQTKKETIRRVQQVKNPVYSSGHREFITKTIEVVNNPSMLVSGNTQKIRLTWTARIMLEVLKCAFPKSVSLLTISRSVDVPLQLISNSLARLVAFGKIQMQEPLIVGEISPEPMFLLIKPGSDSGPPANPR
jgi:hypothetical protein